MSAEAEEDPAPANSAGRSNRALEGGTGTLAGAIGGGGLALLATVLVTRHLGVETYGLYALGLVFASIGEALATFGMRMTVLHFLPIFASNGENSRAAGTVIGAALSPLLVGSLLMGTLWLAAPSIARNLFRLPEAEPFIRTLAIAIPLMSMSDVSAAITRGFGFARYAVITRNIVYPGAYVGLILVAIALGGHAIWIAYAFIGAHALAFVVGVVSVIRSAGREVIGATPIFALKKLYAYSLPVLLNAVFYLTLSWTDVLMLGYFSTEANVGIYRACIAIVVVFDMVVVAFNSTMGPTYSVLAAEERYEELSHSYATALRWVTMFGVLAFLLIALNAGAILALLGPGFVTGVSVLVIMTIGQLLKCCLGSAAFLLTLSSRQRIESGNGAIAALVNVILNLILIPRFGIIGAAVATATSLLVVSCLRIAQVRYIMKISTIRPVLIKIALLGTLVGSLAWAAGHATSGADSSLLAAIARITTTVLLFLPGVWLFIITPKDRAFVDGLLERLRGEEA